MESLYAAAKFFFFIINTVLSTLFGIEVSKDHVYSQPGLLGRITGYFGVVEAQGRGTLHVHMLLWLEDAPNAEEMHLLLQRESFRERIREFIKENIRAHVDGLDEETIKVMPREAQLAYSRPPNPDEQDWTEQFTDKLCRVVRSQQIHTCTRMTCLRYNKHGRLTCKRRAPWELSMEEEIDTNGRYKPRRTVPFMNNFCPAISVSLCCNNDIKLLSNGSDTKDCMWYSTTYQSKKQGKNHNISALMAKSMLYHASHTSHVDDILDRNRLLIFRCQHALNREMELSAPQVIAYLMRWGDHLCSHRYVPLYWSALQYRLVMEFEELRGGGNV